MFQALLAHPQEALHNGTCYIAYVLCRLAASRAANWHNTHAIYVPGAVGAQPPKDEQ
jgi:hypothetical protein